MNIPSVPHMDPEGFEVFKEKVARSKVYLEYGCGGSTSYAALEAKVENIISVETDLKWIEAMCQGLQDTSANVYLEHCNIGPVGDWGWPIKSDLYINYPLYASMPWNRAKVLGLAPDMVLIDGRFRVASFLYSLVSARVGTQILFDDYIDRPYYHVVEQFCRVSEVQGRMAIFSVDHHYSMASIAEAIATYSVNPA